jgi:hypothetical protein
MAMKRETSIRTFLLRRLLVVLMIPLAGASVDSQEHSTDQLARSRLKLSALQHQLRNEGTCRRR